ncbi:aarA [Symbiodinium natans]|uniref:AarA protein n=1 Tax=Symbiodinium natans TaxID=878477 RepID=A0A812S129_9DINO|nr:aarA [Symbiodinium natans]
MGNKASEPLLPSALRTLADRKTLVEGQIADYDRMTWFQQALFDTSAFQAHADWLKEWRQEWAAKLRPNSVPRAPIVGSSFPKAREDADDGDAEDVDDAGSSKFQLPAVAAAQAALEKYGTDWKAAGMDSVVEEVVNLMQSEPQNAFVQERGCESLRYLCTDDESRQAVAAKDAIPTILRSMELNENESDVQGYCCGTLVHLAATPSTRQSIVREKGLEAVLRAMQMHPSSPFVQFKACSALANIAATGREQSLLATLGGGEIVLKTMRAHVHDLSVLEYCLGALHNLAVYHGNQAALRTAGAVRVLRDAVRLHPHNNQVQQASCNGITCYYASVQEQLELIKLLIRIAELLVSSALSDFGKESLDTLLWHTGATPCKPSKRSALGQPEQKTFNAMVAGADRDKALEIVTRHPGILAAGPDVKDNMLQADVASNAINAARGLSKLFR